MVQAKNNRDSANGGHAAKPKDYRDRAAKPVVDANGQRIKLLTRDRLDGRTKEAHAFDRTAAEIAADLGGEDHLSAIERHLIQAFAGVAVHLGDLHARLLLGEKIDIVEHSTAVSTMVRIASRVGISKRIVDVTPNLRAYLQQEKEETR